MKPKPEVVRQATSDLPRYGPAGRPLCTHLRAIVTWADAVQQALGPWSVAADKALRTRFEGGVGAGRSRPGGSGPIPTRATRCAVRRSGRPVWQHGAYFDGHLLDISLDADSEVLTSLNILPGNGDEALDTQTLLAAEAQAQVSAAAAASIDGIGWNGVRFAEVRSEGMGIEVYVPPPARSRDAPVRPRGVCPGTHRRRRRPVPRRQAYATEERSANHTGWKFVFARRQCAGRPLHARCLATLPEKKGTKCHQE